MAVSKVSKLVEEEKLFRFDQRITSSRCCKYLNICIYLQNVLQKNVLRFLQNEFSHSIFFRNFFSMYPEVFTYRQWYMLFRVAFRTLVERKLIFEQICTPKYIISVILIIFDIRMEGTTNFSSLVFIRIGYYLWTRKSPENKTLQLFWPSKL